jgi:hypothetical protein
MRRHWQRLGVLSLLKYADLFRIPHANGISYIQEQFMIFASSLSVLMDEFQVITIISSLARKLANYARSCTVSSGFAELQARIRHGTRRFVFSSLSYCCLVIFHLHFFLSITIKMLEHPRPLRD